jgi:hypothetical protein
MKWLAVSIGAVLAVGLAVMLVVTTLQKGKEGGTPPKPQRRETAVTPKVPTPAPSQSVSAVPSVEPSPVSRVPSAGTGKLLEHPQVLTGTLRTVDASGILGYLPVGSSVRGSAPVTPRQLLTSPETQITLDGKASNIAALRPGMDIAFLDSGDKPLEKLEAFLLIPDGKEHLKEGPIDKIEPNILTILAGRSTLFPVKLNYSTDIPTTLDGKPATAADLRYRMLAAVTFIGNDARSIAASTVIMDGAPHHADGSLVGTPTGDSLTIRVYGNSGFDVKLRPDPNFKILRETARAANGAAAPTEDATMADLRPGLGVVATYTNGIASDVTIKFASGARGGRAGGGAGAGRGRGAAPAATGPGAADPNRP